MNYNRFISIHGFVLFNSPNEHSHLRYKKLDGLINIQRISIKVVHLGVSLSLKLQGFSGHV